MKRRLSPIYYVIPVVYIGVILFFLFMQFHARKEFSEKVGSLSVSGVYARTLGGGQRMRHLQVQFHDLRMEFSPSSSAIAGFGASRQKKLALESYAQFPGGFELILSEEAALRFVVEGELGDRVVITPIIPRQLQGMRTLSIPFSFTEGSLEAAKGIPLLVHRGPAGTLYVSLGSGSQIDAEEQRFLLRTETDGSSIVVERLLEEADPYLYWFSRDFRLVGQEELAGKVQSYLDGAYRYWNGVLLSDPGSGELIGELGTSLISEAVKRGEYRRILAVISRNLRQLLAENADNPALYNSAAYLGNLPSFLSARQRSAAQQTERITELIRGADFRVFRTPRLLRFILAHAPFSLVEEVLRLADSVQLETADTDTLVHLVNVYLEEVEYLDVGEMTLSRISEIIDRFLMHAIVKTPLGLFLGTSESAAGAEAAEFDLYDSILAGRALIGAGNALDRDSYGSVGRSLIHSALDLADAEGLLPRRISIRDGNALPKGQPLYPQSIYRLLPGSRYTPEEYPLYSYLYPGSWVWTVSRLMDVEISENRYRFSFSFPTGDTHYLLIQGIRPMTSVNMHGIPWKSDPEYFRYTDGWLYDEGTQTLYVKMTHRAETEELVLSY
ncbi:MAG: hypothetical protein JXB06_04945 [Spirochaetales bacterium]|nr:hypothetical protein [Spirochaetales bacterium]